LDIGPDLTWIYTLDHVKAEKLSNAVVYNDILNFVTDDSSVHQISISITGTDDAAVISGVLSGAATEGNIGDTLNISGSVSITDVDTIDNPEFVAQTHSGIYGELVLNADGDWNYLVDQSSIQNLDAGVEVKDTITIVADDFSQQKIIITLTGSDDTSVYSGSLQGEILEGDVGDRVSASSISGSLSISDIDSSDNPTISSTTKAGQYGTLSFDSGSWTYVLNEDARDGEDPDIKVVQSLAQGESLSENISITASDGTSVSINITIRGTNDGPDLIATSFTSKIVTEDSSLSNSAEGKLLASDVEGDTSITFSITNAEVFSNGTGFKKVGSYGNLFLEADGSYSYILDNGLYSSNILGSGQTGRDNFVISISDSAGAKTDQAITFEIHGADESAIITGALIGGPI